MTLRRNTAALTPLMPLLLCGLGALGAAGCAPPAEGDLESGEETATEMALASGTGLAAQYFTGVSFNTPALGRTDATVNFDWGTGSPATSLPVDNFSVRWTGQVEAPVSGSYTFTTTSDDGVRLWVNGQQLVNDWTQHAATDNSGTITLTGGQRYTIKMEYYEGGGRAVARLAWAYPGQARQIVPTARLYRPATASPGVTVSGNQLLRNGVPWRPKGLSMIGSLTKGAAVTAYSHWGDAELAAGRSWGADAMRLQVSQPALDPQSSQYSAAYLQRLRDMVALGESHGYVMILSMQDQSLAGGDATPLPDAQTVRSWRALGPVFANDPNVIYELFNEPDNVANASGWAQWRDGGSGWVGHQQLVTLLRDLGATNVLLADGAQMSEILPSGATLLNDPLRKIGYAVHPYYMASINTNASAWDQRFGNLAAQVPVVATEWNAVSRVRCRADDPELSARLLPYLRAHNIGVFGWAFDWPDTLVKDWSWTPTNFENYTCGVAGGGAGALLRSSFAQ